jgi:hypothetical protein
MRLLPASAKKLGPEETRLQLRRKYLQLPIIVFEVAKVVQTLNDFEHVQKLAANFRLCQGAQKNSGLTELAQVPMRRHLVAKIN